VKLGVRLFRGDRRSGGGDEIFQLTLDDLKVHIDRGRTQLCALLSQIGRRGRTDGARESGFLRACVRKRGSEVRETNVVERLHASPLASRFPSELGVRGTMRLPNRKEELAQSKCMLIAAQ
jgi:hypothetical protein